MQSKLAFIEHKKKQTSHPGLEASARSTRRTTPSCRVGEGFSPGKIGRGENTDAVRKGTVARRATRSERSSQQSTSLCDRLRTTGRRLSHTSSRAAHRSYPTTTTKNNRLRALHSARHSAGCKGSKRCNCSRHS
jgi:hypothetical protein